MRSWKTLTQIISLLLSVDFTSHRGHTDTQADRKFILLVEIITLYPLPCDATIAKETVLNLYYLFLTPL